MQHQNNAIPAGTSWLLSLWAWFFVSLGTIIFFIVGLFVLFPLSILFENGSGRLPHRLAQFWAKMIYRSIPVWRLETSGLGKIQTGKSYVVVSNHQSLLDILVLLAALPLHFKFIAKRELFWIPFFGWYLWLARYTPLKRGDAESGRACLEKARGWLKRGVSVVFFPEGTRSPDGEIHLFKPGAFKLALEETQDILPLVISGTREAIPKYSWRIEKRAHFFLSVQDPVPVRGGSEKPLEELRDRVYSVIASEFERIRS